MNPILPDLHPVSLSSAGLPDGVLGLQLPLPVPTVLTAPQAVMPQSPSGLSLPPVPLSHSVMSRMAAILRNHRSDHVPLSFETLPWLPMAGVQPGI